MAEDAALIDLPQPANVDWGTIRASRLHDMAAAAADVVECRRVLAKTGGNIVGELLRGADTFYEWDHYPAGDVYDHESHAQFYYHAHPHALRGHEHGHFHTFMRPRGMPAGIRPAPVADLALPEDGNGALSHLVGISMDDYGVPIRLFTTNRWVTGEVWYAGEDVQAMLDGFRIDHAQPSWPVNRWIGGMVRLFRPQIETLIEARDSAVAAWGAAWPGRNVLEDRALEITSVVAIDVDDQIARVAAALESHA